MIKNVFCVGQNYMDHVKEQNNSIPDHPVLFSKPTNSIIKAENNEIKLPFDKGKIHYEAELVFKLAQDYSPDLSINELISEMTVGLDLTLREVQVELKRRGHPWLLSKGFPSSAILGKFISFPGLEKTKEGKFYLSINNVIVQDGNIKEMIFHLEELIHYIGGNLGLNKGDIIFTGTPSGVGALKNNDYLTLSWNANELGKCRIKM